LAPLAQTGLLLSLLNLYSDFDLHLPLQLLLQTSPVASLGTQ
jgi:hypothetical protein